MWLFFIILQKGVIVKGEWVWLYELLRRYVLSDEGFTKVSKKAKIPKKWACASTFTCLGGFVVVLKRGVCHDQSVKVDNLRSRVSIEMVSLRGLSCERSYVNRVLKAKSWSWVQIARCGEWNLGFSALFDRSHFLNIERIFDHLVVVIF